VLPGPNPSYFISSKLLVSLLEPFLIALSILSLGTLAAFAASIAVRSR